MMKRFFCETEDYNFVAFVDDSNKAYMIDDTVLIKEIPNPDEYLTIDNVKNIDYSNLDGCETAEDCAFAVCDDIEDYDENGNAIYRHVFDFDPDEYERVTEF